MKPRRIPTQQRSRDRVDAILLAAKSLIGEKGSAGLRIQALADRAAVTPASIYQYFPNKAAILRALAQRSLAQIRDILEDRLQHTSSKKECFTQIQNLIEEFYQQYRQDPAMADIWISMAADKSMQDLDLSDSRKTAELLQHYLQPHYPERDWPRIRHLSLLLAHLSGSAVRLALTVGHEEGEPLMEAFRSLIVPELLEQPWSTSFEQ